MWRYVIESKNARLITLLENAIILLNCEGYTSQDIIDELELEADEEYLLDCIED